MTANELQEAEQKCRDSRAFYDADREARNAAVRAALEDGWSQARVSKTIGLSRGRIHQIVKSSTVEHVTRASCHAYMGWPKGALPD